MSEFANPASSAAGGQQATAYISAVLRALGNRDPLEVMRSTPEQLAKVVNEVPTHLITAPESTGKWSIAQVIQHLADSEIVGGFRFRMVMTADRPPLTAYDQDLWAERLRYSEVNVREALEEFTVLRRSNVRLFENASSEDWMRVGVHSERGEESLRHLLNLYAGHDIVHLRQIDRIRKAVGAGKVGAGV
jgi:hypothetical protein